MNTDDTTKKPGLGMPKVGVDPMASTTDDVSSPAMPGDTAQGVSVTTPQAEEPMGGAAASGMPGGMGVGAASSADEPVVQIPGGSAMPASGMATDSTVPTVGEQPEETPEPASEVPMPGGVSSKEEPEGTGGSKGGMMGGAV